MRRNEDGLGSLIFTQAGSDSGILQKDAAGEKNSRRTLELMIELISLIIFLVNLEFLQI